MISCEMESPANYLNVCSRLDRIKMIECINKGLDKSLGGAQTRNLVLKALKVVHSLDKKDIPSSLNVFESLMIKMFGDSAASMILNTIANECKNS